MKAWWELAGFDSFEQRPHVTPLKRKPWSSALAAKSWLSAQLPGESSARDDALRLATAKARTAGAKASAENDAARLEREREITLELKKIRGALTRLQRLERSEARAAATVLDKSPGLSSVPWAPREHRSTYWAKLSCVVRTLDDLESEFLSQLAIPSAKRARGQRAKAEAAKARARYIRAFFEAATGRAAAPRDLALMEIAFRLERPCADVDEFSARCKRLSKTRAK